MCAIHLPLLSVGRKAFQGSTKYSIYITTEKALETMIAIYQKYYSFFYNYFFIFNACLDNLW